MPITTLLNEIHAKEIVLPDIQRDFVWPEPKIQMLMDSIMRGYPIGIVLMWETYNRLMFRPFVADWRRDRRHRFKEELRFVQPLHPRAQRRAARQA